MSDSLSRALERLRTGFLGARHREVLAGLLTALGHAVDEDKPLPTYVNATYVAAVHVLGTQPADGSAR